MCEVISCLLRDGEKFLVAGSSSLTRAPAYLSSLLLTNSHSSTVANRPHSVHGDTGPNTFQTCMSSHSYEHRAWFTGFRVEFAQIYRRNPLVM